MSSKAEDKRRPRFLVIDSHPLRRLTIVRLLKSLDRQSLVVDVATVEDLAPDASAVVYGLAVLHLGGRSFRDPLVAQEVAAVRDALSSTPLVTFSDREEIDEIRRAIAAGVQGFVPTSFREKVAVGALEVVLAGGEYFPRTVAGSTPPARPGANGRGAQRASQMPPAEPWTDRERDVAERLRCGESNKVIARALGVQVSTVKLYVRRILRKLGASNRTQAALLLSKPDGGAGHAIANSRPGPPVRGIGLEPERISLDDHD